MKLINVAPSAFKINQEADDMDPFVIDSESLQTLIDNAPNEFDLGFLTGIYNFRLQLAILTDRNF